MSDPGLNPWLTPGEYDDPQPEVTRPPVVSTGPTRPHPGLHTQLSGGADSAPSRTQVEQPRIWFVGVHGGAGESTLAELRPDFGAAGHDWPRPNPTLPWCVLVARTNAAGLYNARAAAKDWAADLVPAILLGLVLIPDAPGKLPKQMAQEITRTSGGVPRVWQLPWIEDWRYHAPGYTPLDITDLPRAVKRMLVDLDELTMAAASKENPSQ
jgi:hypothetical protein